MRGGHALLKGGICLATRRKQLIFPSSPLASIAWRVPVICSSTNQFREALVQAHPALHLSALPI